MLSRAYGIAASLAEPALRLHLARRARIGRELAGRLPERRGLDPTPRPPGPLLWVHAASVGEALSVLPVTEALARVAPEASVLMTSGTVTSQRLLAERRPGHIIRFAPLDVPRWVARFLDHWRPDAAAFVESELWPATLAALRVRKIPAALLNARLSPRSFARWSLLPGLAAELLGTFAAILAQSDADAQRIGRFAPARSPGNLKLAAAPLPCDPAALAALRQALAGRPAWVAASIHPAEDALFACVHATLAQTLPQVVSILMPRHPERGAAMARALGATLRSRGDAPSGLYVSDLLGEPGLLYRAAPVVVMGRSFAPPGGGQNPLEPARLGAAVAIGPRHGNFAEIAATLAAAGALTVLPDPAAIVPFVRASLDRPRAPPALAKAGHDAVAASVATLLALLRR